LSVLEERVDQYIESSKGGVFNFAT